MPHSSISPKELSPLANITLGDTLESLDDVAEDLYRSISEGNFDNYTYAQNEALEIARNFVATSRFAIRFFNLRGTNRPAADLIGSYCE